jgi:hypothetical protein
VTNGVLKIAPIEKATPPEAEALAARLDAMLPRIRITDLLAEVAGWTDFPNCFTHLRTGDVAADSRILMAGLLADGLNLGLRVLSDWGSRGQATFSSHRSGRLIVGSIAPVTARQLNVSKWCQVEIDDGFERVGCRAAL